MFSVDKTAGSMADAVSVHFHPRTNSEDRVGLLKDALGVSVLAQLVDSYLMNGITHANLTHIPERKVYINIPPELDLLALVHIWKPVCLRLPKGLRFLVIGAVNIHLEYPPGSLPATLRHFSCTGIAQPRKPIPFIAGLSLATSLESFIVRGFTKKADMRIMGDASKLAYICVIGLQSQIALGCSRSLMHFGATQVKAPVLVDLSPTSALLELRIHDNRTRVVVNAIPDTLQFLNLHNARQVDLAQIANSKLERLSLCNVSGRLDLSGLPEGLRELFIKNVKEDLVVKDHIHEGQVRAHLKQVQSGIKNELA